MAAGLEPNIVLLSSPSTAQNSEYSRTLKEAYQALGGDLPSDIPFLVWLLENPDSPIALPGKIDLYRHDCIHILLNRGFSLHDEAFIIGFTMGNDPQTNWLHFALLKLVSMFLYPKFYRFNREHFKVFDLGVLLGKKAGVKNLNKFNFDQYQNYTIDELRKLFGIDLAILNDS